MKVYYHATYLALLPSIQQYGLGAKFPITCWEGIERGVYLADCPALAESFAETSENTDIPEHWLDGIVILEISEEDIDTSKLCNDPNYIDDSTNNIQTFLYRGIVTKFKVIYTDSF